MQPNTIIGNYFTQNPHMMPGSNVAPQQAAPTGKKKSKKGSGDQHFASSLISEAGGTGGALAGAATGAALGSIVPGVGTVIGGVAGGLIGGFAGGTGGRLLENQVRDHELRPGDALKEGAISGVLGAGPGNILKLGGKAAGVGLKGGAMTLENAVMDGGAQAAKTAVSAPLKTSARGKLLDKGNQLLESQYGTIGKNIARGTDPRGTISKLADMGITSPKDAERISQAIGGADGIINKAVMKAVGGAGNVPLDGIPAAMEKALQTRGLVDNQAKSLKAMVDAQLKNIDPTKPETVIQVMRNLEEQAAEFGGKGGTYHLPTSLDKRKAKALGDIHDELRDSLYKGAGANDNVHGVLTPDVQQQLLALHPNNPKWAKHVTDIVTDTHDVGSLRHAMAPFVNISKIIREADMNGMTYGGRVGNLANDLKAGSISGVLSGTAINAVKGPAARAAGTALRAAGGASLAPALEPSVKGIIGRGLGIGGLGEAAGSTYGAMKAGMPAFGMGMREGEQQAADMQPSGSNVMGSQSAAPISGSNVNGQAASMGMQSGMPMQPGAMQPEQAQGSPYSLDALRADIQRDPQHADDYIGYYKSLDSVFNPQAAGGGKLNATQIQQANTAQSGMDSLGMIAQTLQNNPNAAKMAALPGGSFVQNKTGTGEYVAARANAIDAIGRLRSGGAISADEQHNFMQFLPAAFDDPQTVQYKLQALNSIFQRFANPQPGALEDASMITQGGYQ
jgi:hypothetical protein